MTMTLANTRTKVIAEGNISRSLEIHIGLRQGDPIALMLFNLGLKWAIQKSSVYTKGSIYHLRH